MGTNLSLADIKKIAKHMISAYITFTKSEFTLPAFREDLFNSSLAVVLKELHLTTLSNDLLHEIKNVRGD